MSVIGTTTTKAKLGLKVAKAAAKRPRLLAKGAKVAAKGTKVTAKGSRFAFPAGKLGLKAMKPIVQRRARHRAERLGEAARTVGEVLAMYGPTAAYELGLVDPPKPKRMAPRVVAGVVVGASAVYFLEPEHGREHREKLAQLVS